MSPFSSSEPDKSFRNFWPRSDSNQSLAIYELACSQFPRGSLRTRLEVDVTVLVHVERPEHVVTELLGIARREEHLVHIDELDGRQLAVRAVLLKTEMGRAYRKTINHDRLIVWRDASLPSTGGQPTRKKQSIPSRCHTTFSKW